MKWTVISKTIIGAVIYILPTILQMFGYSPSSETIDMLNVSLTQLLETIGGFLAIYGLRDAQGGLTWKKP